MPGDEFSPPIAAPAGSPKRRVLVVACAAWFVYVSAALASSRGARDWLLGLCGG